MHLPLQNKICSKSCFARFQALLCHITSEKCWNYTTAEEEEVLLISKEFAAYCEHKSYFIATIAV